MAELKITEGVSGTWFYHLSHATSPTRALCGAWVMSTSVPLSRWGRLIPNYHINERFCSKCTALRAAAEAETKRP